MWAMMEESMMTLSDFDWPFIRQNTLIPTVTALVAVAALAAAYWMHTTQSERFSQLRVNRAALHEDYDALVYRRRLVDLYHRRYLQFHGLGFVGRESRLDWVETLRTTTGELTLPRVAYAIEPQLKATAPVQSVMSGEEIQIYLSKMQLEIGLVHELDLLRFFDELQAKAPGLIKVDSCDLNFQVDKDYRMRAGANIQASCAIKIFSVITSDVGLETST
jgi:hypothetical protein